MGPKFMLEIFFLRMILGWGSKEELDLAMNLYCPIAI